MAIFARKKSRNKYLLDDKTDVFKMPVSYMLLLVIVLLLMPYQISYSTDWSTSNIQLLHGDNFKLGSSVHNTLTVEHASGWQQGDVFLFLDIIERNDVGTEFYGEIFPRLSISKLINTDMSYGFVKDIYLAAGFNADSEPDSDPFRAYLYGLSFNFNFTGFDFFQLDVFAYNAENTGTTGLQITPAWDIPFNIGNSRFRFRGFLDWISGGGTGKSDYILTQPQLLLDIGHYLDKKDSLFVGLEYWYWHNKFGIDGVTEHSPQAMLMWKF
jgi:nucleoside-specific outer membrane channel protein Tsx